MEKIEGVAYLEGRFKSNKYGILFYACTATFNYCSCTIVEDVRNGAQPVLQGSQPTVDMVNDNQVFGNPRYACMIT